MPRQACPQRLKPHSKQISYRSGKPLRHPKSNTQKQTQRHPITRGAHTNTHTFPQLLEPRCELAAFLDFVLGDYAVFDVDDAVGVLGDVVFVSDEDDRIAL
jgi:hypothetical protein